MASRTAALKTRNVVSSMRKHAIDAAKAGVMAAAMGMMLIAIKIPAADRRPVVQAGNIQQEYDVTIPATLKAQEGEGARKSRTQNRTMEGGGAAVARGSPADGPDWLEMSHRAQLWEVAIRQAEPRTDSPRDKWVGRRMLKSARVRAGVWDHKHDAVYDL